MFPVLAGVVPTCRSPGPRARDVPRARGGGPVPPVGMPVMVTCSPRSRGWSRIAAGQDIVADAHPRLCGVAH